MNSVPSATVDIGRVFVEGGFLGLVIYAILLAFFLLLVRDFLKDYAMRAAAREQAKANLALAKAMYDFRDHIIAHLSLMTSANALAEWQRKRDKGELPRDLGDRA